MVCSLAADTFFFVCMRFFFVSRLLPQAECSRSRLLVWVRTACVSAPVRTVVGLRVFTLVSGVRSVGGLFHREKVLLLSDETPLV